MVHENHIIVHQMLFYTVHGFHTGLNHDGFETESFHQLAGNHKVDLIVIDNHDTCGRRLEGNAVAGIVHGNAVVIGIVIRRSRILYFLIQGKRECTSFVDLASYGDVPAHQIQKTLRDDKSQTGTFHVTVFLRIDLSEGREQLVHVRL